MFRNKLSQRDLFVSNPTDHFLGPFSQEQALSNGSSSETLLAVPNVHSQENSQRSLKDWQSLGSCSNKKTNVQYNKYRPFFLGASKDPENNFRLHELKNEAVQRDVIDMLHLILENQRTILEGNELKEFRSLLVTILETQRKLLEEQREISSHHQECTQFKNSVKASFLEIGDQMSKILQNQEQESSKIQTSFEKHLKVQAEANHDLQELLRMGQLQDSFDKALREHKEDMQLHFQKQMAIFNMEIIKTFQNQCTRSFESKIKSLFSEYFTIIMENIKTELVSKMDTYQNHLTQASNCRDQKNMQWMENALQKLQHIQSNKTSQTVRDNNFPYKKVDSEKCHPLSEIKMNSTLQEEIEKAVKLLEAQKKLSQQIAQSKLEKEKCSLLSLETSIKNDEDYGVVQKHQKEEDSTWIQKLPALPLSSQIQQNWASFKSRGLMAVPTMKKAQDNISHKSRICKKPSEKVYPLRSYMKKPPVTMNVPVSVNIETSSGISCSSIGSHAILQKLIKRHSYGQPRRFPHLAQKKVDDLNWI